MTHAFGAAVRNVASIAGCPDGEVSEKEANGDRLLLGYPIWINHLHMRLPR